jgi:hypothetical protein
MILGDMDSQTATKNRINTLLIVFVLLNIIGDIGNVIFWYASPNSQGSLVGGTMGDVVSTGGYLASAIGGQGALIAGSIILLVVAVIYIAALLGLLKRQKLAPLLVIAISIVNRLLALVLFEISFAFAFWGAWTVILVVVAYLDYRKLSAAAVPMKKA